MTGATSALPKALAIFSERTCTRRLCLPNAMCGPFCSVPPIGTRSVVLPDLTRSRSSVHVNSSRKTVLGGWLCAVAPADNSKHVKTSNLRLKVIQALHLVFGEWHFRCFCCFCRKLTAAGPSSSAEILGFCGFHE